MSDLTIDDLPAPEYDGTVPIDDLHADGDNPNSMTDKMFGLLVDRLRRHGWLGGPVITNTDGLIADGEHRWRAAKEVGLTEVPVRQYAISDAERRMWRQELNKIRGSHDTQRDALEYDALLDAGMTDRVSELTDAAGEDLDDLLASIRPGTPHRVEYDYTTEHSVHFEDCVEGIRTRLADDSVDCVITDPPYGVDIDVSGGMNRTKETPHKGTVDADGEEAFDLFDDVLGEIDRVLVDDGLMYVFASWKTYEQFATRLRDHGFTIYNVLVWKKTDTTPFPGYQGRYQFTHEWVIFAGREDARRINGNHRDHLDFKEARFADVPDQLTMHPTQKPIALLAELMTHATDPGDLVLDPFMGSGSTAVAAIQEQREYVGFELDEENYRDTIERRIRDALRSVGASASASATPPDDETAPGASTTDPTDTDKDEERTDRRENEEATDDA